MLCHVVREMPNIRIRERELYSGHKVICTCKMSLTFAATVDFVAVKISEVLETLILVLCE